MQDLKSNRERVASSSEATVLSAIAGHAGPLIVDLDETLYLRNSTEDFLDSAVPGLAAVLLLRLLDLLQPWHLTGRDTRDVWRVGLILLLMPWTLAAWRRRVPVLAETEANGPLRAVVAAARPRAVIATLGFGPIVRPLLAALGLGDVPLVAMRPFSLADRRRGKHALVVEQIGAEAVARSLVVTDSAEDAALLAAAAVPLRVHWPAARWIPALRRVYLPGLYLARVKRPGGRYIRRMILPEDFAFWVLASVFIAPRPLAHVAGLALLLLSLWAVYERGYVDNDRAALRFESEPRLSPQFHGHDTPTPRLAPWLWAAAAGVAGLWVLAWPNRPAPGSVAAWGGVLVLLSLTYAVYNRLDKMTRVWLFALLHVFRVAAFAVVVPVTAAGAAALSANVAARWLPYFHYRITRDPSWAIPMKLLRLCFFLFALVPLLAVPGVALADWSLPALVAWTLLRAQGELAAAMRGAGRIDRAAARH